MTPSELPEDHNVVVFSLASGSALAAAVCEQLGVEPGEHEERDFEDGEHKIRPLQAVRGRDVYLVQSLDGDETHTVNDKLMRLLSFAGALHDAGAERITCLVPYLCYSRKDRRTKTRDPLTTRYVAQLFEAMGIDQLLTIDVHNVAAFQNAFRIPTEHLTAAPLLIDALRPHLGDREAVVVSPDAGGAKRAEAFRQALEAQLARPVDLAFVEKFRSEGVVRGGTLVGPVEGRNAILVDDLVSSGGTLVRAAAACRERGATATYAAVTHGVFSSESPDVLRDSALAPLVVTNTLDVERRLGPRAPGQGIQVVDCAPLLARAIACLHTDAPLTELTDAS